MDNGDRLAGFGQPSDIKLITKGIQDSFIDVTTEEQVKKKTFSPSRLAWGSGGCPRNWYFLFNGVNSKETISSFAKNNMQSGSDGHARMQDQILSGPLDAVCEEQLRNVDPPINSFCDVIVNLEDKRVPIEIKTCNDLAFEYREASRKAADYHILQLLVYMKILGTDLGFVMYENKNTYDKIMIPVRMTPEHQETIDNAWAWMQETRKAYEDDEMPKYFKNRRKNSKICGQCAIKEACDEAGDGTVYIPLLKDYSRV